ncbi:hypothetical protein N665_1320s0004 [Sinapis alba]|nr:hypothetical protein N665_1320s0004 [Sinapis alba]
MSSGTYTIGVYCFKGTVFCSRHNFVCKYPGSGIVLRVEEAKKYLHCENVFHELLGCGCGIVLEKEQMFQHQARGGSLRLIACRFCGDMVEAVNSAADVRDRMRGISEHESTYLWFMARCKQVYYMLFDTERVYYSDKGLRPYLDLGYYLASRSELIRDLIQIRYENKISEVSGSEFG